MALTYDPEFLVALGPVAEARAAAPKSAVGDVEARRERVTSLFKPVIDSLPDAPGVKWDYHKITSYDGAEVPVIQFTPKGHLEATTPGPAIVFLHGGGMIIGRLDFLFAKAIALHCAALGAVIIAPDYRVAPEDPHPAVVEDSYAALKWTHNNAAKLNVDPARIALYGESAGGGVAAGMALMARDRQLSPPLAKQILIYPMLDDRNLTPNPAIEPLVFWSTDDNITGWQALLGGKAGKEGTDPYAAPARAESLKGLPPTYIDVGELDIFRDECIEFAGRLAKENISVELHVYPRVPHAFEVYGSRTSVGKRAIENRRLAATNF